MQQMGGARPQTLPPAVRRRGSLGRDAELVALRVADGVVEDLWNRTSGRRSDQERAEGGESQSRDRSKGESDGRDKGRRLSERLEVLVEGLVVDRVCLGPVEREAVVIGGDLRKIFVHVRGHERSGLALRHARGVESVAKQL